MAARPYIFVEGSVTIGLKYDEKKLERTITLGTFKRFKITILYYLCIYEKIVKIGKGISPYII